MLYFLIRVIHLCLACTNNIWRGGCMKHLGLFNVLNYNNVFGIISKLCCFNFKFNLYLYHLSSLSGDKSLWKFKTGLSLFTGSWVIKYSTVIENSLKVINKLNIWVKSMHKWPTIELRKALRRKKIE